MDIGKFLRTSLLMLLLFVVGYFSQGYLNRLSLMSGVDTIMWGFPFFLISFLTLASSFYFKDRIYLRSFIVFSILLFIFLSFQYAFFSVFTIVFTSFMVIFLINPHRFFENKGFFAYAFFIFVIGVVLDVFSESIVIFDTIVVVAFTGFFVYPRVKSKDVKGYLIFLASLLIAGATSIMLHYIFNVYEWFIIYLLFGIMSLLFITYLIYKLYVTVKEKASISWKQFFVSGLLILALLFIFYPRDAGYYHFLLPHLPPNKECKCIGFEYSVEGGCDTFIIPLFTSCRFGGLGYHYVKCMGIPYDCRLVEYNNLFNTSNP